MDNRKLFKCYDARFLVFSLIVGVVIIGAALLAKGYERGSAPRFALAALQAVATASIIVGSIVVIRRLDELQQRIHLESLAIAAALTTAFISGWGFFEKAGAPLVEWSRWAWPMLVAFWMTALLGIRRRYQ